MESPLVSVIVPIYNISEYVDACVTSIIHQTYSNIEIVLVDDGSTDISGALCDKWGKKDKRIRVIHKPNGGLSDARNAGLEVATGKYICFVDGDDTVEPDLLSTTIPYLERGYDLVRFRYMYHGTTQKASFQTVPPEFKFQDQTDICRFVMGYYLTYKVNYEVWSGIYKADIIQSNHLRFVDNKKIFAEDVCFFLYYIPYCRNIKVLENQLYNYTRRDNSIMGYDRLALNVGRVSLLGESVYKYYKSIGAKELLKAFPAIFFVLIDVNVYSYILGHEATDILSLRDKIISSIPNKGFFIRQMLPLWRMHKLFTYTYSTPLSQWEKINTAYYYIIGSKFLFCFINKFIYTTLPIPSADLRDADSHFEQR